MIAAHYGSPLVLLAMAFSTQLLPMTVDMLYCKWGTRQGAVSGLIVGLRPFFPMLAGDTFAGLIGYMKRTIDIGSWALIGNGLVFVVVSRLTRGRSA